MLGSSVIVSGIIETTEFTQGFFAGLFATEGILGISSCIESVEPIAKELDDFFNSESISQRCETMGSALLDVSHMIDTCEVIPDDDK